MSYGVQEDGSFERKHVDTIRKDLKRIFKNELGEDIELRPSSPITQILDAAAVELARQWAAAEGAYYASFYQDASGEALDKQLALAGFSRIPTRPATGEVEFSRSDPAPSDITISAGTVITTERTETRPRIPFETTKGVTLAEGETSVTAPVEGLKPWQTDLDEQWLGEETNVAAGTIVRFGDPVSGVDAVTNPEATGDESLGYTEGRDKETDAEFKLRYENSLAEGGAATVQAVKSGVYNHDEDIVSVKVEEVRDSANSEYGVRVIVLAPGVADDAIAQAVLDSRAGGLQSFGASTGTGTLDDGTEKTESFERASELTIEVDATLTTSSTYPSDGSTTIEDKLIRYIGGVANDGLDYPGLEIGEDVIYDQVFRRVMEVQGVVEADVQIAVSGNALSEANIAVANEEAARTSTADISITEN
jgi:uncharacterized phage protein gp47/JayE